MKHARSLPWLAGAVWCASFAPAHSAEPEPTTRLFALTCMQYFYTPEKLKGMMGEQHAIALEADKARFFLGGKEGDAWAVQSSGRRYVVSLRRDGICAVFAQQADAEAVQAGFEAMVGHAPTPLVAYRKDGGGPNSELVHTTSYAWHRPQDTSELLFTATTSTDPQINVQAMISLGLARK